jgi:hypothetical protein
MGGCEIYRLLPTYQAKRRKQGAARKEVEIMNMIMVGVKHTDFYLPFLTNTYLF